MRIILLLELEDRAACFCHDSGVLPDLFSRTVYAFAPHVIIQMPSCKGFWAVRVNVCCPYGSLQFADLVLLTLNELLRNENNS